MRLFAAGWMVIGFAMVWCGVARAGTYDVWGCRVPDGKPAPINGWQATPHGSYQSTCASGGLLETELDFAADVGYYVDESWYFRVPIDTTIDNFTVVRAVAVGGDREYHLYRDFASGNSWPPARTDAETCITWFGPCSRLGDLSHGSPFSASGLTGTVGLSFTLDCQPRQSQVCPRAAFPDNGVIRIWSTRIGLADTLAPAITAGPSGSLIDDASRASGTEVVTFAATDRGGGLQTMGLLVDGVARAVQ